MEFSRRTAQILHEDHNATKALMGAIEAMIASAGRTAPDLSNTQVRQTLEKASSAIPLEVRHHFAFEEEEIFSRLADAGIPEIGKRLSDDHRIILPLGLAISDGASRALNEGFTAQSWAEFRDQAADMISRLQSHILMEDMELLPLIDEVLDAEADMALSQAYADAV